MKIVFTPRLAASLATLALWALVAASALYWVWRVRTPPAIGAPVAGGGVEQTIDTQAVARALGAVSGRTAAAETSGRFVLRGVVTHGPNAGAGLIAIDGKPPKPVRVGAPLPDADGWTLRSVAPRGAVLAEGARQVTLDVPQPDWRLDTHATDVRPEMRPDVRSDLYPDSRVPVTPASLAGQRGPGLLAPHSAQRP